MLPVSVPSAWTPTWLPVAVTVSMVAVAPGPTSRPSLPKSWTVTVFSAAVLPAPMTCRPTAGGSGEPPATVTLLAVTPVEAINTAELPATPPSSTIVKPDSVVPAFSRMPASVRPDTGIT